MGEGWSFASSGSLASSLPPMYSTVLTLLTAPVVVVGAVVLVVVADTLFLRLARRVHSTYTPTLAVQEIVTLKKM